MALSLYKNVYDQAVEKKKERVKHNWVLDITELFVIRSNDTSNKIKNYENAMSNIKELMVFILKIYNNLK